VSNPESPDEAFARVSVARATKARIIHLDNGTSPGAVDYLMNYDDGRTGALEVTSVSGSGEQALAAELAKLNHTLPPHPGQFPWSISVTSQTSIKKLKQHYTAAIAFFESIGVCRSASLPYGVPIPPDVAALLKSGASFSQLGTKPLAPDNNRPVYVWGEMRAGFIRDDLEDLPGEVEAAFEIPHVLTRLRKVCARLEAERHLFVWFGPKGLPFSTDYAMTKRLTVPSRDLRCPPRLTHLWAMTAYSPVLLGWCRESGWRSYDVFDSNVSA
jgi:hypothetical protein